MDTKLSASLTNWLLNGERGLSSETLARTLGNVEFRSNARRYDHPHDLDDFRRCEVLLRECPGLRSELHRMADVSPQWSKLVAHWDEIVRLVEDGWPGFFVPRWEQDTKPVAWNMSARDLLRDCVTYD